MSNTLFDIEKRANPSGGGLAKKAVTEARRHRAGVRSSFDISDDSGLEISQIRTNVLIGRHLIEILRDVATVSLPSHLAVGGVDQPNQFCRKHARILATDLYEAFGLFPSRIAASVEGGILLAYRRGADLRLEIEIDNDGDITGAISTSKRVVRTETIDLPAKLSKLVRDFRLSPRSSSL